MIPANRIIVIGTSAGGLNPLLALISQFPSDLKASVFIVKHVSPDAPDEILVQLLNRASRLAVTTGFNEEPIAESHVYVAPPGRHLLLKDGDILVNRGPRENGMRPSVDALFRSAAASYGARVIGVVLSGLLADGTAGLEIIKRCGGKAIIQSPDEAPYPDMPKNALQAVEIDYVLKAEEIGRKLVEMVNEPVPEESEIPRDIVIENRIAERVLASIDAAHQLGKQVPFSCPECGGALWHLEHGQVKRFRCHAGHVFTADAWLQEQANEIEEVLWIALRLFEERRGMYERLASDNQANGYNSGLWDDRIIEAESNIKRIRKILTTSDDVANETR